MFKKKKKNHQTPPKLENIIHITYQTKQKQQTTLGCSGGTPRVDQQGDRPASPGMYRPVGNVRKKRGGPGGLGPEKTQEKPRKKPRIKNPEKT